MLRNNGKGLKSRVRKSDTVFTFARRFDAEKLIFGRERERREERKERGAETDT